MTSLSIDGQHQFGQGVRSGNVTACVAEEIINNSSLGPVGLDKMLMVHVGDVLHDTTSSNVLSI